MLDWLYSLKTIGIMPGLEKITQAMEKLGNPQDRLKIIHVAGTNGKGSVCAMIESVLRKSGCDVGLFTSPTLVDFTERFQVNRRPISKEDVYRLVNKVKETGIALTFFELTTAVAFLYFCERQVDYAVIEVGMGGRLDATNIVNPAATVITSISFDHTRWLGDSIDKIASEKAGIAKKGVPLFTVREVASLLSVRKICGEKGAPLIVVANDEQTSMNGAFQRKNAGLAAAVARHIGVSDENIHEGLMDTYWPARLEFIEKNILLDCAHNPDGIEKLSEFVSVLNYDKLIIVFGVMKDKDYGAMTARLPEYDTLVLTKPQIDRALDPGELNIENAEIIDDVGAALKRARSLAGEKDLIVICGSCYLAGELLAIRKKIPVHPIMFIQ